MFHVEHSRPVESRPLPKRPSIVTSLAVSRWLLAALWRRPEALVALGSCFLAGMLLPRISPAGLPWANPWDWFSRWSFPAGLLGAAAATVPLSLNCSFLERAAPTVRWQSQWTVLTAAALLAQVSLALGQAAAGGALAPELSSLAGVLVLDLHIAGFAVVLLGLGLGPATTPLSLVTFVWLGARLAADGGGGWLAPLLDVSGHPHRFRAFAPAPESALICSAPVVALLLLTRLHATPSKV